MRRLGLTAAILSIFVLAACAPNTTLLSSNSTIAGNAEEESDGLPPSFAQFSDIPVPDKAVMDLERTILLGSDTAWTGRLVFSAPYNASGMFDFYMAEMPKFGWKEITVIRSEISAMTFAQDGRVATIQLTGNGMSGTEVLFSVSPHKIN